MKCFKVFEKGNVSKLKWPPLLLYGATQTQEASHSRVQSSPFPRCARRRSSGPAACDRHCRRDTDGRVRAEPKTGRTWAAAPDAAPPPSRPRTRASVAGAVIILQPPPPPPRRVKGRGTRAGQQTSHLSGSEWHARRGWRIWAFSFFFLPP